MYSNLLIIIQTLFQIIWLMAGTLLRRKLLPAYPEMDLMNANLCWLLRSNRYHKQSGMWAILDVIFLSASAFGQIIITKKHFSSVHKHNGVCRKFIFLKFILQYSIVVLTSPGNISALASPVFDIVLCIRSTN